jgi:hypothetical protein
MLAGAGVGDDPAPSVTQCHAMASSRYVCCFVHSLKRMLAGVGVGDDLARNVTQCHDRSVCSCICTGEIALGCAMMKAEKAPSASHVVHAVFHNRSLPYMLSTCRLQSWLLLAAQKMVVPCRMRSIDCGHYAWEGLRPLRLGRLGIDWGVTIIIML